jgi:general stress protein CsbA
MAETIGNANQTVIDNEFDFSKTKGLGSMWFFLIRKKQKTETIPYEKIDKIEVKTNFAKGDFISAVIVLLISLITAQCWGLIVTAILVFCSYGKNIVITRKDTSSNVIIMTEGFGETEKVTINVNVDGDTFMWEIE